MDGTKKSETHLTSAAAFVEGGIQESCDDACSICLEAFGDSDPSTVTSCKHEFHLQCILEWCQRSSQCPMCWQPISLKDPTSQELLEAVEKERSFRLNSSRTAAIFHHPTLGDFELQHLPIGANDAELEERIIQHLAAAAAMGRARHIARREGQRSRPSAQGHPQLLVFSTRPNTSVAGPASSSPAQRGEGEPAPVITAASVSSPPITLGEESSDLLTPASAQAGDVLASASGSTVLVSGRQAMSLNNRSPNQSSPSGHDRAGSSSEVQSFSESLKSRFAAMSTRYKESISKSTKGWKDRWFSRNNSVADLGSEIKSDGNSGIATVSHMMEHLETRDNSRVSAAPESSGSEANPVPDMSIEQMPEAGHDNSLSDVNRQEEIDGQASCPAGSGSN